MAFLWKLFVIFCIHYQFSNLFKCNSFNITLDELSVGKPKNYTLNSEILYVIEVKNLSDVIEKVPPRIFIECDDCNENEPLLIVVGEKKGVMSWELPVVIEPNNYHSVYKSTGRTICPFDILTRNYCSASKDLDCDHQYTHPVMISLSTSSVKNVSVDLVVNLENNFVINLNENKTIQVTPSTPSFYMFEFEPENVSSVLLHVTSEDDTCMIVSIQNVTCPVFDLEENVGYRGHFQTVTKQGGFTLTKEAFPEGFFVVLIVSSNDRYCSNMLLNDGVQRREKNVTISISKTISLEDYRIAVGVTILIIVLFCSVMFFIFLCSIRREKTSIPFLGNEPIIESCEASTSEVPPVPYTVTSPVTPVTSAAQATPVPNTSEDTLSIRTDSSLDETDFDLVNDAESDKNIFRLKNYVYLSDLARKNISVLKKKSEFYVWILLIVGIFYFLPVIQLVFTDQYRLNQSGKEDICYYNFLCSHPLWRFSDFNHMFSNIGYISFGALFMFLTVLKENHYKVILERNKRLYRYYGIPQHFGLFYAMGCALIFEGILSLCYHICPNHYNFQFDTSFMYIICTLCMVKIYQTRHPDINAKAHNTFALLAGVIFLGMYGVFSSSLTYLILFTILHLSTCIFLSLKIYYMGRLKLEYLSPIRMLKDLRACRGCQLKYFLPSYPSRFALLVFANACNWGLAVGSFIYEIKNFSSYLLTIFMVNLVLYTTFYILMKFICKEKIPIQSIIYILLALLCWSAALHFFLNKTISWRVTPAQSKLYNQKCILFDFYDNHDIWHFISAAAMFFSFMVLLTLDDGLTYVKRTNIVVF